MLEGSQHSRDGVAELNWGTVLALSDSQERLSGEPENGNESEDHFVDVNKMIDIGPVCFTWCKPEAGQFPAIEGERSG